MDAVPTPPASEVGDVAEIQDDCVGCRRIREIEALKYEREYSLNNDVTPSASTSNSTIHSHDISRLGHKHTNMASPSANLLGAMNGLSLSQDQGQSLDAHFDAPQRIHELHNDYTILAMAVSDKYIFAGNQRGEIFVWSLETFQLVRRFQAHKMTIMSLCLSDPASESSSSPAASPRLPPPMSEDAAADAPSHHSRRSILVSTACDQIISVWCPNTFQHLYEIYYPDHIGHVFASAYSAQQDTLFIGASDTSVVWIKLSDPERRVPHDNPNHPSQRRDPFFDSKAISGQSTPRRRDEREALIPPAKETLEIYRGCIGKQSHTGFVRCMLIAKGPTVLVDSDEEVLITGGGEGLIRMWQIKPHEKYDGMEEWQAWKHRQIMSLGSLDCSCVYAIAVEGSFLYSGKRRGVVELWDLDTKQKLRVIKDHRGEDGTFGDIMSVTIGWGNLWSTAMTGTIARHSTVHSGKSSEKVSQKYQCLSRWQGHNGKIQCGATTTYRGQKYFLTGGSDRMLNVWRIDGVKDEPEASADESERTMLSSLREFVSYKTVSARPEFAEECRQGASFLCNLFKRLGAQVSMLSLDRPSSSSNNPEKPLHNNPVVYAHFKGKLEPASERKRILFYGHYDVVPADRDSNSNWRTDPFEMEGTNGYLYGRGVSDNKGPIMAALYAVTDLLQAKQLDSDVIFLIEGEEESGSRGFQEIVKKHKEKIGHVDYIILANSYWIDDETPCLTYGLRGVLHANICVDSIYPDLHSGVDGSHMLDEPLSDLMKVLTSLTGPKKKIMIPGFYDGILPLSPEEEARYEDIVQVLSRHDTENVTPDQIKASLIARWREPNLTFHRTKVSGLDDSVVSSHASAAISMRLVPGQQVDDIIAALKAFLHAKFAELESKNTLTVKIDNKAEPWLGDTNNPIFKTLEEAIVKVWNLDSRSTTKLPLYIREGGSIPAIRFLEKEFEAPVAHFPCGQATDSAHLENERIRLVNLLKSREIFGEVFRKLS